MIGVANGAADLAENAAQHSEPNLFRTRSPTRASRRPEGAGAGNSQISTVPKRNAQISVFQAGNFQASLESAVFKSLVSEPPKTVLVTGPTWLLCLVQRLCADAGVRAVGVPLLAGTTQSAVFRALDLAVDAAASYVESGVLEREVGERLGVW